ncbi:hypothetical protein B0O99DRAFT_599294 [Bisporella sp. PMI_857]|nr:hypothetical protein B0O99DRAFT_599294 [Bisporella sp. PMI_857]
MHFTTLLAVALAAIASATPIPTPEPELVSALEKRTGGNVVSYPFCAFQMSGSFNDALFSEIGDGNEWPGPCPACIAACMAVANPIKEFDPTTLTIAAPTATPTPSKRVYCMAT